MTDPKIAKICLIKVNPENRVFLKPTTRGMDVKFQKIQGSFVRTSIAVSKIIDHLLQAHDYSNSHFSQWGA